MELKDLRREIAGLARMMNSHDITEVEIVVEGLSVKLRRESRAVTVPAPRVDADDDERILKEPHTMPAASPRPDSEVMARRDHITITAPMVGTFYRAPAPDADPYVKIDDVVLPGQTVCIIEAMKIMNEIQSEVKGRIAEILVDNAEPVEYGQPLFVLEVL